jgi:hypothetical protein
MGEKPKLVERGGKWERFGRRWLPKSAAIIENGELRMRGWLYRKLTEPAKEAA